MPIGLAFGESILNDDDPSHRNDNILVILIPIFRYIIEIESVCET